MNTNELRQISNEVSVPIQKISTEIMEKVNAAPQGQRKTSKHKKVVKIVEDRIFKGPYTSDEQMLIKNLSNTYAVEVLEDALKLPDWQRGSLRWEYVGCWNGNCCYLIASNVGKCRNISWEIVNTKIETNVKVVPRGEAVRRVSDIEGTALLTDEIKSAALQHLYIRFLLDLGDSGTHNILVREDYGRSGRLIAGIDLEEKRSINRKESRLDNLFKKGASKKQIYLYHSDVCNIKSLSYGQLGKLTIERLSAVGIDLERIKENMELWERLK